MSPPPAGDRRRRAPRRPRCRAGTSCSQPAAAQVVALADAVTRHGHVVRRPRAVARRPRRPEDADDRRADRRRDVARPGVAGHHDHGAACQRHQIGDRRRRRDHRRAARVRDHLVGKGPLAVSPQRDGHQTVPLPQRRRQQAEARRRPALVRPLRAGVEQRVAAASLLAHRPRHRRLHAIDRKLRHGGGDAERLQQTEIDLARHGGSRADRRCRRSRDRRRRCRTAAPAARADTTSRSRSPSARPCCGRAAPT